MQLDLRNTDNHLPRQGWSFTSDYHEPREVSNFGYSMLSDELVNRTQNQQNVIPLF